MKKTFYYARVSSKGQHEDRQLAAFAALGADEHDIIVDKVSGKTLDRPGYQALKRMIRDGDTVVVKSIDRLSRNKRDIMQELAYFREHNIRLKIIDLPTTTTDFPEGQEWIGELVNNILLEVLSSVAEQELHTRAERQQEGIRVAHARGQRFGRPAATYPPEWEETISRVERGELTATGAMDALGMKRTTFYKLRKQWSEQNRT